MIYPFEADYAEIQGDPEPFITAVFSSLESEFLVMPKGNGFIDYPVFEAGYESLKRISNGFTNLPPAVIIEHAMTNPVCLIVLRAMMGFNPSEWAYLTSQRTGVKVTQGFARTLDRKVRLQPTAPVRAQGLTGQRLTAMITAACTAIPQEFKENGWKFEENLSHGRS
jgi:hypothetical protein